MIEEQTLVRIREREHLDLLDLSILVIRRKPWAIALAAAAGIAPFAALNAWLLGLPDFPPGLWPVLLFFEAPWATAPLTLVLGGLMFGRRPGFREVMRQYARAVPAMLFVHVFYRAMRASIVLLPFVSGSTYFANPVILLEKAGPRASVRRSARLGEEVATGTFRMALAEVAFGLVFAVCFGLGTGAAIATVVRGETTWDGPALADPGGIRFQIGVWIAIAFVGVARFFVYLDRRVRSEGWELRFRLRAAASDVEGAPR